MRTKRWLHGLFALLLLSASFAIVACGDDDDDGDSGNADTSAEKTAAIQNDPNNAKVKITVGSKNFNENKILGEIYAQGMKAAGYTVSTELNLGDEQTAFKAIETKEISGLSGVHRHDPRIVPQRPVGRDPQESAGGLRAGQRRTREEGHYRPLAHAVRELERGRDDQGDRRQARQSEDDLRPQGQGAATSPSTGRRSAASARTAWLGLQDVYGLKFKKFVPVAIDLRHEVLEKGQADLSIVFTTDPQIARNKEVLLQDDKGMFPPNNSVFIIDTTVAKEAWTGPARLSAQVQKGLTPAVIQELNARADLDKKTPEQVASEYLKESGLVN